MTTVLVSFGINMSLNEIFTCLQAPCVQNGPTSPLTKIAKENERKIERICIADEMRKERKKKARVLV